MSRTDLELAQDVAARSWYHTLELRPGIVTPGWFDTRGTAAKLPFPPLEGKRCLDVGTFEGFWAFEMERLRAAEVVAIDLLDPREWDWPWGSDEATLQAIGERKGAGEGFVIAATALGSRVTRYEMSVYDLDPGRIGSFDFVYMGSLLLHLRDPVRAVEAVRGVLRPHGQALFVDAVDIELSLAHPRRPIAALDGIGRPWWWYPNRAGFARVVESGGWRVVRGPHQVFMPAGAGQEVSRPHWLALGRRSGRLQWITARRGDPHAWILAAPRPLSA